MVSNFKVSIVALLVSVAAVSAVESGDDRDIHVEYHQIPVMHDGGTSDGEFDFHHGSSNVQYEATSRSAELPHSHQHIQMMFYPHQYATATQKQPQQIQQQQFQHTAQQIQYLPQQIQHAPQQIQNAPQQIQHAPQQIQHAPQQIQHAPQHAPQFVQYHVRKPSMREQGWIPIVGTPQGWVPINKPVPPPHMWKHQSPPKKFVYVSKPKFSSPKHAVMKQVIHVPAHGSQKMVALPLAEHTLRLDIPHPFKIPDNKHEVVHIPEEQLSKYLAQMGVQYKTDDGMLTAHA